MYWKRVSTTSSHPRTVHSPALKLSLFGKDRRSPAVLAQRLGLSMSADNVRPPSPSPTAAAPHSPSCAQASDLMDALTNSSNTTAASSAETISDLGQTFFGILGVHALGYALKKLGVLSDLTQPRRTTRPHPSSH